MHPRAGPAGVSFSCCPASSGFPRVRACPILWSSGASWTRLRWLGKNWTDKQITTAQGTQDEAKFCTKTVPELYLDRERFCFPDRQEGASSATSRSFDQHFPPRGLPPAIFRMGHTTAHVSEPQVQGRRATFKQQAQGTSALVAWCAFKKPQPARGSRVLSAHDMAGRLDPQSHTFKTVVSSSDRQLSYGDPVCARLGQ